MGRFQFSSFGCLALAVLLPCGTVAAEPQAASGMVLGGGNSLLAEGSIALEAGRISDGIRLTQEGLKYAADSREAASGHSNLCAGYALLHECNTAIELDGTNWQSFNNRAAAHAGLGQYDLALADVHSGLQLEPQSSTLRKSLAVVEHNQKVINKRSSSVLHS
jgi:hypothetical protein